MQVLGVTVTACRQHILGLQVYAVTVADCTGCLFNVLR